MTTMTRLDRRRLPLRLLMLLALGTLLLSGCGGTSSTGSTGFVSSDGATATVDVDKRVALPAISGKDLTGKKLSTDDYAGKVLVINLWASWCAPCRREAPILASLSKQYADKNVQFLGLLSNDKAANAQAYERTKGIDYPTFLNPDGSLQLHFAKSLPAQSIPVTWIVDAKGRVAARILGAIPSKTTLADLIAYAKKTS